MILMYHKVDIIVPTVWWVSSGAFRRHLDQLIDRQVVPLSEYLPGNAGQCVITFDDAYECVFRHAFPILRERGYPFEIFVNGDLIGRWNRFDGGEPLTRYCNLDHLREMAAGGGRVQWHTSSHPDLRRLDPAQAAAEMEVPTELRRAFPPPHFAWFAYPYGAHSPSCVELARRGYEGAVSVCDGSDDDRYQLNRVVMTEDTIVPPRLQSARITNAARPSQT